MKDRIILIVIIAFFIGIIVLAYNFLQNETNKMLGQEVNDTMKANNTLSEQNVILDNKEEGKEMIVKVSGENFENEVLKSEKTVLIDFYADWCGPCKMLSSIVEQFANENENVKVVKIDVDAEQELAIQYGVMSIPTLVVIKDGQEVNRVVGLISKNQIAELVK